MTRDDIIRMAREAGLLPDSAHPTPETRHMRQKAESLQRFAALVATAEREACARLIETQREWRGGKWVSTLCPMTTEAIAAAIRARGSA